MVLNVKRSGALALRLIVGLALLGWPRMGAAQGTWSIILLSLLPFVSFVFFVSFVVWL